MSEPSDANLAHAAQQGDHGALRQLLLRYQDRMFTLCLRMVGHREDAADLTQDLMLKVIEHIGQFNHQAAVSTWMTRIAINLCLTYRRQRATRPTALSLDQPAANYPDDQTAALRREMMDHRELSPDQRVQSNEQRARLHEALGELEPEFRAVLVLRDLQQMSYQQMAEALGIAPGTVKSRLFRARLALRKILAEEPAALPEPDLPPASVPTRKVSDG